MFVKRKLSKNQGIIHIKLTFFQVYNSVGVSVKLCNYYHCLIPEHPTIPKRGPLPLSCYFPSTLTPRPWPSRTCFLSLRISVLGAFHVSGLTRGGLFSLASIAGPRRSVYPYVSIRSFLCRAIVVCIDIFCLSIDQ